MTTPLISRVERVCRVTVYRAQADAEFDKLHPGYFKKTDKGVIIEGLRIKAKIERKLKKDPNTCDLTIYNLASDSRSLFTRRPLIVSVEAGYDDAFRLLYQGDVKYAASTPKGTEWETIVQLADGGRAYESGRVNKSYAAGTSIRTIVRDAAKQLGVKLPPNVERDESLNRKFQSDILSFGYARDELTALLRPLGYDWSLQNGQLVVLRDDELAGNVAHLISPETNMIGSPEYGLPSSAKKPPTLKVHVLLRPEISPGHLVRVESRGISGDYRAEKVEHHLDTHGAEWTSIVEAKVT